MHPTRNLFRGTSHFTSPLQRTFSTTSTRPLHRTSNMPLVVPGVTADNMGGDKTQEWMTKLAGKTLSEGPSSETVSSKSSRLLICPGTLADDLVPSPLPDLLQDGPATGDTRHRARHDGDQGLQAGEAERTCRGGRNGLARVSRLSGVRGPRRREREERAGGESRRSLF
jgi:hypothetical protein